MTVFEIEVVVVSAVWFHKGALLLLILTVLSIGQLLLPETYLIFFQSLCSYNLTAWMPAGSCARGFTSLPHVTTSAFSKVILLNINGLQFRISKTKIGKISTHQK